MTTAPYPLDFDSLTKGTVLSVKVLESISGHKAGTPEYAFTCMGLQKQIERKMEMRGLGLVTVCQKQFELHILNDLDAGEYNRESFESRLCGLFKDLRRTLSVDSSGFNENQKRVFDRGVEHQGKILQAVATVTRWQLPNEPYTRIK